MNSLKICLLFFVFVLNQFFLHASQTDTIYVLTDCKFLKDSSDERYFITPIVNIDTIIAEKNSLYDALPVPLKTYQDIEQSITFMPVILKLFLEPDLEIILNLEIDENGKIDNFRFIKQTNKNYESLIIDSLMKVQFKPATFGNKNIKLNIILPIKIRFIFNKYIPDILFFEKEITSLSREKLIAFKTFIAEKHIPDEVIWLRKAEKDIAEGKIHLLNVGMMEAPINTDEQIELTERYGFKYLYLGCVIPYGYQAYNDKMMEYLNKINGIGWFQEFWSEYVELVNKERDEMFRVK